MTAPRWDDPGPVVPRPTRSLSYAPVLRVDPQQLHRLHAIAENLAERITEAEENGWAGEVQQLTISLQAARDKIAATAPQRRVLLGLPTPPSSRITSRHGHV